MKTIFIVDDNRSNLLMAEDALSEYYEVITQISAATMFELLEDLIPDLILLDIMMPDMDGIAALKQLKSDMRYESIPVIFLTGKNDADMEALSFEIGVVDYIHKPFSGPVLLNRIKSVLHDQTMTQKQEIV
jgi:putative two-component system response regulator